ncbi:MAG: adenosylmethionine--8-amino-7-oxononanoate transaminase [Bacteroidota bacterium]
MVAATIEKDRQYIWHPYTQMKTAPTPLNIVRGEGAVLYDEKGQAYIDAVSSWWVNLHGHSHPYIAEKIYEQLRTLEHVIFAGFTHPPAVEISERLLAILPDNQSRTFFSDNGSTAVEVGLKMAIQYFHNRGQKRGRLIAFNGAYHGDTFGTMSAGGSPGFHSPFADYLFEVEHIPAPEPGQEEAAFNAMASILAKGDVAAFLYEPLVQGAAGMRMHKPAALNRLLGLCKEAGVLCIADEVMTGFGRTGRLFASNHMEHQPDLMCLSKGLTGGTLPLAITTCTEAIYDAFLSDDNSKAFYHGHSFTANPVGCAAALASMDLLLKESCQERIASISQQHLAFCRDVAGHPRVGEARSQGTILALEFKTEEGTGYFSNIRQKLYPFFLERGAVLRPLGNVIYLIPPYCISDEQLSSLYGMMKEALERF